MPDYPTIYILVINTLASVVIVEQKRIVFLHCFRVFFLKDEQTSFLPLIDVIIISPLFSLHKSRTTLQQRMIKEGET